MDQCKCIRCSGRLGARKIVAEVTEQTYLELRRLCALHGFEMPIVAGILVEDAIVHRKESEATT